MCSIGRGFSKVFTAFTFTAFSMAKAQPEPTQTAADMDFHAVLGQGGPGPVAPEPTPAPAIDIKLTVSAYRPLTRPRFYEEPRKVEELAKKSTKYLMNFNITLHSQIQQLRLRSKTLLFYVEKKGNKEGGIFSGGKKLHDVREEIHEMFDKLLAYLEGLEGEYEQLRYGILGEGEGNVSRVGFKPPFKMERKLYRELKIKVVTGLEALYKKLNGADVVDSVWTEYEKKLVKMGYVDWDSAFLLRLVSLK